MAAIEFALPELHEAGNDRKHHVHEHKSTRPLMVYRATIETPVHVPPLVPGRKCEHDLPDINPAPHCIRCNQDELGNFRDAVELFVVAIGATEGQPAERVLARTSLICKDTSGETDLHVESPAAIQENEQVELHVKARGDGHELPKDFKLRLYTVPLAQ